MTTLHMSSKNTINSLFLMIFFMLFMTAQAAAQDDAEVLMQLVPDQVKSGEQFTVLMQLKNSGTTTWSAAKGYHLATRARNRWGLSRVPIEEGKRIAPGETVTFKFKAIAPPSSGSHSFKWQMRRGNSWFGMPSTNVDINVAEYKSSPDNSDFVYQNIAS